MAYEGSYASASQRFDFDSDFDMDGFPYMKILKQKMFEQLWSFQQYA
jgi:hypothetical protein